MAKPASPARRKSQAAPLARAAGVVHAPVAVRLDWHYAGEVNVGTYQQGTGRYAFADGDEFTPQWLRRHGVKVRFVSWEELEEIVQAVRPGAVRVQGTGGGV